MYSLRKSLWVKANSILYVYGMGWYMCMYVYVYGCSQVAPQTYSNPSHYEGKETIVWVRFDYCDINDLARFRDRIEVNGNSPPLLLIIGYVCGVQVRYILSQ